MCAPHISHIILSRVPVARNYTTFQLFSLDVKPLLPRTKSTFHFQTMKSWFLFALGTVRGGHMTAEQGHCMADDPGCSAGNAIEVGDTEKTDKFLPFRFSHRSHFKDDWDSFIQVKLNITRFLIFEQ